ncbi:MAG: hypothetical protein QF824_04955 [Candidatus Woesearchaeota archaeon]|nr:hypothetical protein [Candidatus Woesearchaeota archaeon]
MNGMIDLMKGLYRKNKLLFVIGLIVVVALVAGCTAQGGSGAPPPSGPIGGSCGG